jgi:hypothetical protein
VKTLNIPPKVDRHPGFFAESKSDELKSTSNETKNRRKKMIDAQNEFKKELGVKWVKGDSGVTYLCPTAALSRLNQPSEEDLKKICVEESSNPQND